MQERKLRIISGSVSEVEDQVNQLGDRYVTMLWNWAVVKDQLTLSVVMIHESELRKMQLAQGVMPTGRPY